MLAPTQALLDAYKKQKGSWLDYEQQFVTLMRERKIEERIDRGLFEMPTVLRCSPAAAEHCHRRLILEYLQGKWGDLKFTHL